MHNSAERRGFPFPGRTYGLSDGIAELGVTVQDGAANLDLGNLTVEVPCHELLAQRFHTMHPLTDRALRSNVPRGFVSTRLRRWYPLHRRQSAQPRYFAARSTSFRGEPWVAIGSRAMANAPAVMVVQGFAFLRAGMTEWAPPLAIASWHLRVS